MRKHILAFAAALTLAALAAASAALPVLADGIPPIRLPT